MSESKFENSKMSSVSEASSLVRQVAGPRDAGESVKAVILRASRCLGFGYSRTKDIWYENARRIDAREMDALRARAARVDRDRAVQTVVGLRSRLAATDPHRNGEVIAALDRALSAMGNEVCTLAVREE